MHTKKIRAKDRDIGVLTTLYVDNRSQKPVASPLASSGKAARWKELVSNSPTMSETIALENDQGVRWRGKYAENRRGLVAEPTWFLK